MKSLRRKVNNSLFDNSKFYKGRTSFVIYLWIIVSAIFFESKLFPFMKPKVFLLRIFGATIGKGLFIKPSVKIKFPWKLSIGDYVWIGENVWIDNLDEVSIGNNCCLSQGSLLLTGNHDYNKISFDYRNAPIILEDGCWVGAKAIVCPGVIMKSHSILSVSSVASNNLDEYFIYQGNPATIKKERKIY